jgi:predicted choloylglycine hydrolase
MSYKFRAMNEDLPGKKWQSYFAEMWPSYKKWYFSEGVNARPRYLTCLNKLKQYMPELVPVYKQLVELAGGSDSVARALSLYNPPMYFSGCSQAVWRRQGECFLIRNYDYHPLYTEGVVVRTKWDKRQVIGMSDCMWGLVDGMNDSGLSVSLAFGGKTEGGDGFGVPLIVRYLLETCDTTAQAIAALKRIPCHMAYNLTVLDYQGYAVTVWLSPNSEVVVLDDLATTNHQERITWKRHAVATKTVERLVFLDQSLRNEYQTSSRFIQSFLLPPLYSDAFKRGFGTLYTTLYRPYEGVMEIIWKDQTWIQSFNAFEEGERQVVYVDLGISSFTIPKNTPQRS